MKQQIGKNAKKKGALVNIRIGKEKWKRRLQEGICSLFFFHIYYVEHPSSPPSTLFTKMWIGKDPSSHSWVWPFFFEKGLTFTAVNI